MKKIAIFMAFSILFQNISYAYVIRQADIKSEKVIPFSFISDTIVLEEEIDIEDFSNVKIEEVYVDNGEVDAYIDDEYICLEFFDGEKSNSIQTVTKTDTLELEDIQLTNESDRIIEIDKKTEIKEIIEVSGDFESARVLGNGHIEVKVSKNAEGEPDYDENEIVKSEVVVKVDSDNKLRETESEWINLEHEIVGKIEAKSGDTSSIEDILVEDNTIKVVFNNGQPKLNETTVNDGHTYFWIDRDADGIFKKYNPNSIYSTDKNKISGKGEYLDENEKDQLSMLLKNSSWTDYCGVEVNGVRYVYPYDKDIKLNDGNGQIVTSDKIEFSGQAFNTEKYTVYFSEDGVLYVPEGKLYSMGELVSGTNGWGETAPNHNWESNETFFNELTGKYETYVKHYKFFYGPENKKAFGGFYTYPYNCILEYQHYKPVNLYSGDIVYTYETEEYVRGYLYNGFIKISYTENKTVKDYPPMAPYNIKYDNVSKTVFWEEGRDDYTKKEDLTYEMQVYAGSWGDIMKTEKGKNSLNYDINYDNYDIKVRTVDEFNQVSEWCNLSDASIELSGEVEPNVIKSGEKISIYAKTKSLSKIDRVEAFSTELGIDTVLSKVSEKVPEYFEMSYDVLADFLEEDDYIYIDNGRYAKSTDGRYKNYAFTSTNKTNKRSLIIDIPRNITFTQNGTIIMPNDNYLNSPINIFRYSNKYLYLHMTNEIGVFNNVTGEKETFVAFENAINETNKGYQKLVLFVPRLKVNTFNYDENGETVYTYIELNKDIALNPVVIRWNTEETGITTIDITIEGKTIYSYSVPYEVINKYVKNIAYTGITKYLKRYLLSSNGYTYPNESFVANWTKIVSSLIRGYDLQEFLWLGYKVNNNEYVRKTYVSNYNNNPEVRNTYRTLILDEYASDSAVKKYIKLIRETNFPIEANDEGKTTFGDDVLDYICEFEIKDILTNKDILPGKYEVLLTAYDVDGKSNNIKLTIIVEGDESQMYPKEEEISDLPQSIKSDVLIGRFFYKNGLGYLEELKKYNKNNEVEGFLAAGETLGMKLICDNAEYIEVDFIGDTSIKALDKLTKLFLMDKPKENGKNVGNIENQYSDFPKKIYPVNINEYGECEFQYFYTIPYGTKQNIHSWSTLKTGILENINTNRLFERIFSPYKLKVTVKGDTEYSYEVAFDVFERWDTVINRNISEFITNKSTKWELRVDRW